jgi:hypothetical protein
LEYGRLCSDKETLQNYEKFNPITIGVITEKADPFALCEHPPHTSIVWKDHGHTWKDTRVDEFSKR